MKFLKISLAASIALGALSTSSFAQPLEEAIRGVDVSGYLRYRYTDDRYDKDNPREFGARGQARHQWRVTADFKTPTVENVALNLGVWYNNNQNVNHGKGVPANNNNNNEPPTGALPFAGNGLGAGSDGQFGIRTFYATITPDSTATTIKIGKQPLDTPITYAPDGDRGTGILVLNNDIPGLTLVAAAFDSWSINETYVRNSTDDFPYTGFIRDNGHSINKQLYSVASVYNTDTSFGNIGGQLWGFYVDDIVDALVFGELSWKNSLLRAKIQYTFAALDNDGNSVFADLRGPGTVNEKKANLPRKNDIFVIEAGANFQQDFQIPLDLRLGYITNFQDGTSVALENEGSNVSRAGKIWWNNDYTQFTTSALVPYAPGFGQSRDVNVLYTAARYGLIDDRLNLGLDFVWGRNNIKHTVNGDQKIKFMEITPSVSWQHSKNLTVSSYYAYLKTKNKTYSYNQDRSRVRVEAKYSF
ncbi:MAG: major outer membrane protein [Helicobacter sp.]|nr:major outer membrane protein [Helicobacter sp.]